MVAVLDPGSKAVVPLATEQMEPAIEVTPTS